MSTPVGCTLYVDGARVADGSPSDSEDAPTALSELSISWGRSTTVDQVEPSTCSFSLADWSGGGSSFLQLLYTGARVDVTAAADVPVTGDPVNVDGGLEAAAAGTVPPWTNITGVGVVARVTTAQAHTGAQSGSLTMGGPWAGASIPPAAPAADPSAWDHLPTVAAGQTWTVSAWLLIPPGGYVNRSLQLFARPNDPGVRTGGTATVYFDPDAAATWRQINVTFTASAADTGKWLGLRFMPAAASWDTIYGYPAGTAWTAADGSWADWAATYIDDVQTAPPAAGTVHREVTVFSGRVTDLSAGWEDSPDTVVCGVTAADFTADLAQRDVGAAPWPRESLAARFARVVAAAGVAIPYTIASTLRAWQMSYLDVDRQQAWPLLADLATSVDGVLWSATHRTTGPYLWLADPRTGAALYVLQLGDDGLVHVAATPALDAAIELDSCDVLLGPVVWRQAVSDVSTRVAVTWQDQTLDDGGLPAPTERTNTVVDTQLELRLGTRRAAVSTLLTSSTDADAVAALILGRLHLQSWRVGGLVWQTGLSDMNPDQVGRTLDLLDGTRRLAAPILLTGLPPWAPGDAPTAPLLLQGGTYTYENGQWTLELTTSSAASQGASLPWNSLDVGWAWNEFAPEVAWLDLVGVAA